MIYEKGHLTFEKQADRLLERGMQGDRDVMIARLASVNYYRLSGYSYPFRNPDDTFRAGTTFETVWQRYAFDRRLRLLIMDAVERIEVAVRSQLAYHHSEIHGPFAYAADPTSLPKFSDLAHQDFLEHVQEETERSRERFVQHFRDKYGDMHPFLPIWMAIEVMSFGTVLTFFRGAPHKVKQSVASAFGMPDIVFESWLLTLNTVRNICAHHGRLWNRENGVKPIIPRLQQFPDWHTPVKVDNNRVFAVLTICRHCLARIAPQSQWPVRLRSLLAEFSMIPLRDMGFPANWSESPLWKEAANGG